MNLSEIKDKPIKTSAQYGVELSDSALMEELKSLLTLWKLQQD